MVFYNCIVAFFSSILNLSFFNILSVLQLQCTIVTWFTVLTLIHRAGCSTKSKAGNRWWKMIMFKKRVDNRNIWIAKVHIICKEWLFPQMNFSCILNRGDSYEKILIVNLDVRCWQNGQNPQLYQLLKLVRHLHSWLKLPLKTGKYLSLQNR